MSGFMKGPPDTPIFQVGVRRPNVALPKYRTFVIMLWMDGQHTKHVTYKLAYHFVWCPKYRKKILIGKLATCIEQEIRRICEANTWTIGALNVQADHVHLFLSAPPSVAPSQIAHTLKGTIARKVFQRFPLREETALGRCVLVSFVLRGQRWGYERGYRAKIYRIGTGITGKEKHSLVIEESRGEREERYSRFVVVLPEVASTTGIAL